MEKTKLEEAISDNKSIREIAELHGTSFTNVRYWLKKHGLKTVCSRNRKPLDSSISRRCSNCGEVDQSKFYGNKKWQCKACDGMGSKARSRAKKKLGVELLGGKCQSCGYDKHLSALQFHHVDPSEKDIFYKTSRHWKWERYKKEILKCMLLCANCHSAYHAGELNLDEVQC